MYYANLENKEITFIEGRPPSDPVCKCEGKFYYFDETWANAYGPFDTLEEAEDSLTEYCKTI